MNEKIKELLKIYNYSENEADMAINFVQDLLEARIDDLVENEPEVTTTILELSRASTHVSDLYEIIEEHYLERSC